MKTHKGERVIALIEAAKGILVLAAGMGLLALIHHDVEEFAALLIRRFHLNPANHYPRIFLELAGRIDDRRLWAFAAGAFAYSVFRLVLAFGLWRQRAWAEWLTVIAASVYLPLEIMALERHVTTLKVATFVCNLAIVVYLGWVLRQRRRAQRAAPNSS